MLSYLKALVSAVFLSTVAPGSPVKAPGHFETNTQSLTRGIDVSIAQPSIDWNNVVANQISFAYIKATEGSTPSPSFFQQYNGASGVGLIRGAYHQAVPDSKPSSGATQAKYFLSQGGTWTDDGFTLPGAVVLLGWTNNAPNCYNLSPAAMVNWVKEFSHTYHTKTTRRIVIQTSTNWWKKCTDDSTAFGTTNRLWIVEHGKTPSGIPKGWNFNTFWQYDKDKQPNPVPGNKDYYNGDLDRLKSYVKKD